jgi:integrase/recombinase XerD
VETERISSSVFVPTTPAHLLAGGFLARYPKITRDIYRIHLRHWFEFCDELGIDPLDAKRAHIETFARHLTEDLGRKPQTVAGKLNAVCGLYRYAYLDGLLPVDPGVHVRRPKIEFISSTNGLTRPEFADVLAAAEKESLQAHAMICLLGLNGLRLGETLAADVEHLGHQRGYRTLFLPYRKGGKVGTMSLSTRTAWAVDQALAGRTTGPILLGRDGERLKPASARRTVRRLAKGVRDRQAALAAQPAPHVRHDGPRRWCARARHHRLDRPLHLQDAAVLRPQSRSDRTQRNPRGRGVRRRRGLSRGGSRPGHQTTPGHRCDPPSTVRIAHKRAPRVGVAALSRWRHGFESRWGCQGTTRLMKHQAHAGDDWTRRRS